MKYNFRQMIKQHGSSCRHILLNTDIRIFLAAWNVVIGANPESTIDKQQHECENCLGRTMLHTYEN